MYINSGYLHNSRIDFKDRTRPLIVGSCGTYRLQQHPVLPSYRPRGRVDYQLLYVATGQAHFFFDKEEIIVNAGNMILYPPGEEQRYVYYAKEHPEIFWVHFTGSDVANILSYYQFSIHQHIYYTGTRPEFRWIFRRMILELQLCRPLYEELLASLLSDLLLLICRQTQIVQNADTSIQNEIEEAVAYFSENYNKSIRVSEYAKNHHISTNHFIRHFHQVMNVTPKQYIVSIRMANAQMLLESSNYSIQEIAAFVGYHDPLYFGQVFRREIGVPPSQYRKKYRAQQNGGFLT